MREHEDILDDLDEDGSQEVELKLIGLRMKAIRAFGNNHVIHKILGLEPVNINSNKRIIRLEIVPYVCDLDETYRAKFCGSDKSAEQDEFEFCKVTSLRIYFMGLYMIGFQSFPPKNSGTNIAQGYFFYSLTSIVLGFARENTTQIYPFNYKYNLGKGFPKVYVF